MELPLVVGVDGSGASLAAVDWAVDEAARHGLPLRLVYGSLWERYEGSEPSGSPECPSEQVMAEHVVAVAEERARRRDPGAKVTSDVLPEDPVSALAGAGDSAFAVVTGSRGRGELKGLLLGSVSLAVAGRARCPVIVVRGDAAGPAGTHERILLGAGGVETGREAVRFAFREAGVRRCVLEIVRAWRSPRPAAAGGPVAGEDSAPGQEERAAGLLEQLLSEAMVDHPAVRQRCATVEGPPHRVLVELSAAADLVIVGARREAGAFGFQLGRTAHALLHHARCPVAVVPQRM
ncbi:universal stress protein [Streptomyces sp. NRRL S-340]|uniref:universal stress protein n=1 Tax=Streptomyces sp. NRRL S-340 TaxID=1463901 RepID=UPI0005668A93|nr:universal stress protein [Streptomyces sp. NRRL S-340]